MCPRWGGAVCVPPPCCACGVSLSLVVGVVRWAPLPLSPCPGLYIERALYFWIPKGGPRLPGEGGGGGKVGGVGNANTPSQSLVLPLALSNALGGGGRGRCQVLLGWGVGAQGVSPPS